MRCPLRFNRRRVITPPWHGQRRAQIGQQTAAIKPAHRPGMTPQYEAALVVGLGDLSLAVRGAARESDEL